MYIIAHSNSNILTKLKVFGTLYSALKEPRILTHVTLARKKQRFQAAEASYERKKMVKAAATQEQARRVALFCYHFGGYFLTNFKKELTNVSRY